MLLNRESILKAQLKTKIIDVPEWGGSVRIREMTGAEVEQFSLKMLGRDGKIDTSKVKDILPGLVVKHVIDEEGNRIFTDNDVRELARLSGTALNRVGEAIQELSGMGDKKEDDLPAWLQENHPEVLKEYQDSKNPVEVAKENF